MLSIHPEGPCSVQRLGPSTECKEIHTSTSTKDTDYRGILGLSDSQSVPTFTQICVHVRTGRDNSGKPTTTIRNCLRLLGHMTCTIVTNHARLCLYCFQGWLRTASSPTRDTLDRQVTIPLHIKNSLNWWKEQLHVCVGITFCHPTLSMTLTTNASMLG